ncbi:MAG: hypothetical protein ABFD07_11350 [Methanobacterium sp.]|jgi:hypothetical protein
MYTDKFEDLKGKTIVEIQGRTGDEEIIFITQDGIKATLYYEHD